MESIHLRSATFADAEMVFDWRNALETRQYSLDSRVINKTDHLSWFEKSLAMPERCLLIAEQGQEAIGVLRYDLAYTQAEISIYLRPGLAGKGLGTQILLVGTEWMKLHFPEIKTLQAKVIMDNAASARAFEKAGFKAKIQVFEKNIGTV